MKYNKLLFIYFITLCALFPTLLQSQVDTAWTRIYNGPDNGRDEACSIKVDAQGNVYVTGSSQGSGTADDYATIKYNSAGAQQWVQRYNGSGSGEDYARAIAVDPSGNVYVTGYGWGPGAGFDYLTTKYNSVGVQQWVQRYNGPGNNDDVAYAISVDSSGNVYVTGYSAAPSYNNDYATIKYNSVGAEQWVQRYNGPGNEYDEAYAIAIDGLGNVYVTGESEGLDSITDYATIKYNSTGIQQWVQRYNAANASDYATAIAVDNSGNVYVTGYSWNPGFDYDYATIKYVQTQGIEEDEIASLPLAMTNVELYPNPAKTYFTIRLTKSSDYEKIKIFNVMGKDVREILSQVQNDNIVQVSLDGIKNGIYFVRVGNELVKEKLVIMR